MLSLTKLFKYATLRREQLVKQNKIDEQLERLQIYCPNTVANTYRLERKINNKNSSIAYQYSTLYNTSVLDKMLIQVNNFYDNIDIVTHGDTNIQTKCDILTSFIDSYITNFNNNTLNLDNINEHNGPIKYK